MSLSAIMSGVYLTGHGGPGRGDPGRRRQPNTGAKGTGWHR